MSITPGADVPLLGDNGRPVNNPLVVLNTHLGAITAALDKLAAAQEPIVPHLYTQAIVNDPGHGAIWGTFCVACTQAADDYTYPCRFEPEGTIKPPAFFTIGDVFEPDEHGRMLKHGTPST